eukprot:1423089-Ditylum_brightwellii.AAC.1
MAALLACCLVALLACGLVALLACYVVDLLAHPLALAFCAALPLPYVSSSALCGALVTHIALLNLCTLFGAYTAHLALLSQSALAP